MTQAGFAHLLFGVKTRVVTDRHALATLLTAEPTAGVVMDYALFDIEGVERLLIFIRRFAEATWLLVGTDFSTDLLRLFSGETNVGFLPKDASQDEVSAALKALVRGEAYTAEAVRDQLHSAHATPTPDLLTATERDVVRLLAQGKTSREIAEVRHSSIHTIVTHKKNIFRKLGLTTTYDVTRYALRAGIADPLEYYI